MVLVGLSGAAIVGRSDAGEPDEQPAEAPCRSETEVFGYLPLGHLRAEEQLLGKYDAPLLGVGGQVAPRLVAQQVVEVGARQSQTLGERGGARRGETVDGNLLPVPQIVVYERLQLLQQRFVFVVAGDELPVIEPPAIVEQQFEPGADDGLRKLVHPPLQFGLQLVQALLHDTQFAAREVEGLDGFVFKEGEVSDAQSERCTGYQFGGEEKYPPAGSLVCRAGREVRRFAGRSEKERGVAEIAFFSAEAFARRGVLAENHHVAVGPELQLFFLLVRTDDADQRMERLLVHQFVAAAQVMDYSCLVRHDGK